MKKRWMAVLLCLLLMLPLAARAEAVDEFPGLVCGESFTASLKGPAIPMDASDISFSVDTLPEGLSLTKQETGGGVKFVLTGTPKKASSLLWCRAAFSWLPAGEEETETETRLLAITVNPAFETDSQLPDARVGEPYRVQLKGRSGYSGHIFRVKQNAEGLMAAGLTLSEDGVLSGTPTAAGEVSFSVAMNVQGQPDTDGYRTEQSFILSVAEAETAASTTPVPVSTTPPASPLEATSAAASKTETEPVRTTTVVNMTTEKAEPQKNGKANTEAFRLTEAETTMAAETAPRAGKAEETAQPTEPVTEAETEEAETVPAEIEIPILQPWTEAPDAVEEEAHWELLWLLLIPAGAGILLILVWALRRSGGKHSN